jgi:hypothetical protein
MLPTFHGTQQTFPFKKGRTGEQHGRIRPKQYQNLAQQALKPVDPQPVSRNMVA